MLEQADAAQRAHDGENAEQAGERLQIEVAQVRLVGRYEGDGRQGGEGRHDEHRALAREAGETRGEHAHGSAPWTAVRHRGHSHAGSPSLLASVSSARYAAPCTPQALPSSEATMGVSRHTGSAQAR